MAASGIYGGWIIENGSQFRETFNIYTSWALTDAEFVVTSEEGGGTTLLSIDSSGSDPNDGVTLTDHTASDPPYWTVDLNASALTTGAFVATEPATYYYYFRVTLNNNADQARNILRGVIRYKP